MLSYANPAFRLNRHLFVIIGETIASGLKDKPFSKADILGGMKMKSPRLLKSGAMVS